MKIHNFSAGPSILPQEVMQQAAQAVKELDGSGLSLIEISHRSKAFVAVMEEACERALRLTGLEGKGYKALFLQGGASQQFLMAAYNLLEKKAGYINTGTWSTKAMKEAQLFGEVVEIASSKDQNFNYIPDNYTIPTDLDYLHLTTNNTIFGTQFKEIPDTQVPLVADMSSDIFSRTWDYSKFDLFYAGAQKNMGPAGTTLVLVKEELLGKVSRSIPSMLDYAVQIKGESMFNTPPVFAVYTSLLTMRWIEEQGGLEALGTKNSIKATHLYGEIDRNSKFTGFAATKDRSEMNATFNLTDPELAAPFDALCETAGISGLKGHRSVGGYRASIYNALPMKSVETLVDCMQILENNH
ncbi:MAG: 3-phosphoserine/phosphohydroxythreonine transaminase [Flavobacteriaceae bacterium]|nr:3-phosphoserine/phosphohydroxythreonine transaminase [Flavobacteriaceae bacterium]